MTLGTYLKAARKREGWQAQTVAAAADISQQYLCDIERDRRDPSPEVLERLRAVLKLDPAYTVYRDGRFPPIPGVFTYLDADTFNVGWDAFLKAVEAHQRPVTEEGQ